MRRFFLPKFTSSWFAFTRHQKPAYTVNKTPGYLRDSFPPSKLPQNIKETKKCKAAIFFQNETFTFWQNSFLKKTTFSTEFLKKQWWNKNF